MPKVWLVTGAAKGLGRDIAIAALEHGDNVVASARTPALLDDLLAKYGACVRSVALDVTDENAAHSAVQFSVAEFGRIDVLVNNAGYGHVVPFEHMTSADFREQMDTNFFGVVNLTRAVVPRMRAQRSGHIIHISSVGGRTGTAGLSAYQSAKWAVGGFTEVMAQELAPFGVKVTTLEPGGMRTNWGFIAKDAAANVSPDYETTVGVVKGFMEQYVGREAGDPARVAQIVVKVAAHDQPPVHLLIGSDAYMYATATDAARTEDALRWRAVSDCSDAKSTATTLELPEARPLFSPFALRSKL